MHGWFYTSFSNLAASALAGQGRRWPTEAEAAQKCVCQKPTSVHDMHPQDLANLGCVCFNFCLLVGLLGSLTGALFCFAVVAWLFLIYALLAAATLAYGLDIQAINSQAGPRWLSDYCNETNIRCKSGLAPWTEMA
jgi:hypothetical protein